MATVQDAIESALTRLGVLAPGETPDSNMLADGLTAFVDMVDSWMTERLNIYTVKNQTFALTAGQQTYTMGDGGDFNVSRPAKIERGVLQVTTNPSQPFEIQLEDYTDQQYAAIRLKNLGNTYPQCFYDDGSFPLRSISFWPIPDVSQNFICWFWSPITTAAALNETLTLPPGYARAIKYNLALEIAPDYGNAVTASLGQIAAMAAQSKAVLRSLNSQNNVPFMACDPALTQKGIGWGYYAFLKGE